MKRAEQMAMCRAMRCAFCRRAPTAADVEDMVKNFGAKLEPGDVGALVWHCYACCDRKPEVSDVTRERKDTRIHLVAEIETILAAPGLGSTKAAKLRTVLEGCKRGEAHDYKSPHVCGKVWVLGMLRDAGCAALASRVIDGEFDEEADEEDKAEMAAELADSPALRRLLKLPEPGEA